MANKKRVAKKKLPKKRVPKKQDSTPLPPTYPPLGESLRTWPHWAKVYWGILGVYALTTLLLSLQVGVNADDIFQNDYSEKLTDYYLSAGQDTSALYIPEGNMHLYGGLFETVSGMTNRALGFESTDHAYHHVRHLLSMLCAILILFFTSWWAKRLGGWPTAVLALLLLGLAPRFTGHGLMNPKDIPFALGFAIHLYYLSVLLDTMPRPSWRSVIGAAVGICIAIGLRSGGILLICYLGLFFLLHWWQQRKNIQDRSLLPYIKYGAIIALSGYVVAILFWPYALQSPIKNVLESFAAQAEFAIRIRLLFMGDMYFSDATPWYYAVLGLLKTVPLHTWLGVLAFLGLLGYIRKRVGNLQTLLPAFAFLFPLVYLSIQNPNLYSGWRHILFVHPGMVVIAALGWVAVLAKLAVREQKVPMYASGGTLALLFLLPLVFMVRNGSLMYVYFNELNIKDQEGRYELDYWGLSTRQAVEWMEAEGLLEPKADGEPVKVVSNYYYGLSRWILQDHRGDVKPDFIRYRELSQSDWDYAVVMNHFINGEYLRKGYFPPEGTIHTIYVNKTPVAAIIKNDEERTAYRAFQAAKGQKWEEAIALYQQAVEKYPKDVESWMGLAQAYLQTREYAAAAETAKVGLEIDGENEGYLQILGLAQLNMNDGVGATQTFQRALEVSPESVVARYYLAQIAFAQKDYARAIQELSIATTTRPNFAQAYLLAVQVYKAMGDEASAQQAQQTYDQLTGAKQ